MRRKNPPSLLAGILLCACAYGAEVPSIVGNWWQIAGVPDLGTFNHRNREPVDFAIWQAADDTWQAVSCIRKTGPAGDTRILFRWEGASLFGTDWDEMGIFMRAEPEYGEQDKWIQAPYLIEADGLYRFYYGGGDQICVAAGTDGKTFERVVNNEGKTELFRADAYDNARDVMIMKSRGVYYAYYTGSYAIQWPDNTYGAIFCRTSTDLVTWSDEVMVSTGGLAGGGYTDAECPFVVERPDGYYFFRTQDYINQKTTVYRSPDPLDFGIDDDQYRLGTMPVAAPEIFEYDGSWYMASLMPGLTGLRIAEMEWPDPADSLGTWAGYPVANFHGDVNTGDYLGWIRVYGDFVWSYELESWLYAPEQNIREDGGWIYWLKIN